MEQLGLSRMLVIPTKTPPHKAAPDLADSDDRLAMCRIAFEGMEGVTVSDMEIRREGKSFTVDTVHELKKEFLDAQLFSSGWKRHVSYLPKWKDWQEILKTPSFVLRHAPTESCRHFMPAARNCPNLERRWCLISGIPCFFHQIREKVKKGESCRGFIDPKVEEYILHHGLYKGQDKWKKRERLCRDHPPAFKAKTL